MGFEDFDFAIHSPPPSVVFHYVVGGWECPSGDGGSTQNGESRASTTLRGQIFQLNYCHQLSGRHGIRTHTTMWPLGLANRPGKPYPATFRILFDPKTLTPNPSPEGRGERIEMRFESASGPPGSRTPIAWLQARHLPV